MNRSIHVEVDACPNRPARRAGGHVTAVLGDVRSAVTDWRAMRQRCRHHDDQHINRPRSRPKSWPQARLS